MTAFSTFFVNLSLAWEYVFGILFIWAGIASVIMALKFGKWVATIGAVIRIALIAFFTLTVLIYAGEHGLHGFGGGASKPTWLIFLAATPILIFNLEGFELPSAAAEEMVNPRRDVPFAILRSGIGTVLFYGVPILAILLVLPPSRLSKWGNFTLQADLHVAVVPAELPDPVIGDAAPGGQAGEISLTGDPSAKLPGGLGEHHGVAPLTERTGSFQAGRAGTDDQNAGV